MLVVESEFILHYKFSYLVDFVIVCINRLKDFGSATAILLVPLLYLVQQICTFSRKESVLYGR